MLEGRLHKTADGRYAIFVGSKRIATYNNYKDANEALYILKINFAINKHIRANLVTLGLSLRKRFGLSRHETLQYTLEVIQEMV